MILPRDGQLFTRTSATDSYSGEVMTWILGEIVRCNIQPASETLTANMGRIGIDASHVCFVEAGKVITTEMRISCEGDTYQITRVCDYRMGSGNSTHIELLLTINKSPEESRA